MGNTPPQLRRDGRLRSCVLSPLPRARGHAVSKCTKRSRRAVLRSSRKCTATTMLSVRFRGPRLRRLRRLCMWRRTTQSEASKAASAASADEDSAEASSAASADEEDADSRMLRRFQNLCLRKVPDAGEVTSRAIAARSVRLCRLAGRTEVHGDGPAMLAWLSLAASFEGLRDEFMVKLHKGTRKEKQALMRACILAMNQIGGSSAFRS